MPYDEKLAERVRDGIGPRPDVTEKRMFGGVAWLLEGKMFVGVATEDLMVRVGPADHDAALAEPHVRPMDFTGRPMKGYVFVGPKGTRTTAMVERWAARGLSFVSTLLTSDAKGATPRSKATARPKAKKAKAPSAEKRPRVFAMSFASVYPLYVQKAEKKGRTKAEVDEIVAWLTGYRGKSLERAIEQKIDFETFFADAPRLHPNAALVTGVVCGVRVEDVADPLMKQIRVLDKLVDELARGKKMDAILRK